MDQEQLLHNSLFAENRFSAEEQTVVLKKLWNLLAQRAALYTQGESSSLPNETATELLASIVYCLNRVLVGKADQKQTLLYADYEPLLQEGIKKVTRETRATLALWQYVERRPPAITNRVYRDTMQGIVPFFKNYDVRFFAHLSPCDIDYQLFLPLATDLCGPTYLNAYLANLATENELLRCFSVDRLELVISAFCPQWENLLINLYEPVFQNAMGRTMLSLPVSALSLTKKDILALQLRLAAASKDEQKAMLLQAAKTLAKALGLKSARTCDYLERSAISLAPRIWTSTQHHDFTGIFTVL